MSRIVITICDEPDGSCSIRCEPMVASIVVGAIAEPLTTAERYAVAAWLELGRQARESGDSERAIMADGGNLTISGVH